MSYGFKQADFKLNIFKLFLKNKTPIIIHTKLIKSIKKEILNIIFNIN